MINLRKDGHVPYKWACEKGFLKEVDQDGKEESLIRVLGTALYKFLIHESEHVILLKYIHGSPPSTRENPTPFTTALSDLTEAHLSKFYPLASSKTLPKFLSR